MSPNWVVKPTNNALHLRYSFYTQVVAGSTTNYFDSAAYVMDIGCTTTDLIVTDQTPFSATTTSKYVGDTNLNIYTFTNPTDDQAWCSIISNTAVDTTTLNAHSKVNSCGGSNVCTSFDLYNTNFAETITFKIKTVFTGGLVIHYSPPITQTTSCGPAGTYTFTYSGLTSTQIVENTGTNGWTLPTYTTVTY